MAFTKAWRDFRRMQDVATAASSLIYAGSVVHAFSVLPGGPAVIARHALVWPATALLAGFALPLLILPARRALARYVWMSFISGFGQTPVSVLTGVGLLMAAAGFIYWQVASVATGGHYPAAVFAGYAAGIGILAAQSVLARWLERDPEARKHIQE
ncbi:MAG: hypothetical protein KA085_04695 [Phenylobacterium sp.]|jgi:hypothetical protein|uniref:hypothetical protein n=1 Tax=Phenylobacterium sp. TaxID=1871053 RepID=UPI001B4E2866|nr:hypothetical protein [Phenylobacterium sp.]MBP7815399.1 hypothetical protein [Phenylobacterium sp.]MBP9230325.1 hypothetical protein [Phenylobacterium sp.]MBP9756438.1 hypothetical protein [Phenylobacterium sp.]